MPVDAKAVRNGEDEEVTLVDLLVVCLRYRRVIVGLPLIALLIAAIALYGLPLIGKSLNPPNYTIQTSIELDQVPTSIKDYIDIDEVKYLNNYFSSVYLIKETYAKYFPLEAGGHQSEDIVAYLQDSIIGRKLSFTFDSTNSVYTLRFNTTDKKAGEAFLLDLWDQGVSGIQTTIKEKMVIAIGVLKQQLELFEKRRNPDETSSAAEDTLLNAYQTVLILQIKKQFPFKGEKSHMISTNKMQARPMILILALFGGLFLGIVSAFILNTARLIRGNPESMAKLRAALGRELK